MSLVSIFRAICIVFDFINLSATNGFLVKMKRNSCPGMFFIESMYFSSHYLFLAITLSSFFEGKRFSLGRNVVTKGNMIKWTFIIRNKIMYMWWSKFGLWFLYSLRFKSQNPQHHTILSFKRFIQVCDLLASAPNHL